MVQLTIDTNADSIDELEHALVIVQQAISRRKGAPTVAAAPHATHAPAPVEETALDTPFFKITVASDEPQPTVNDLLSNESITDDELNALFTQVPAADAREDKPKKKDADAFIEIVEFDDEK